MILVPGFSRLFSTSHLPDGFGRRSGAMLLIMRLSQLEAKTQSPDLLERAAHLLKIVTHASAVKATAMAVGAEIDDRLDPLPFEELKSLGEIRQGSEMSPFVANPKVVSEENWRQFKMLDTAGILPFPATVAFANALAEKVYAEKEACHLAQDNPAGRLDAKERHLELSALCIAFMGAVLNPAQGKAMARNADALSYDFVAAAMPNLVRYGTVLQIHDDLSDLLKDKREEEDNDVVSPNIVLADMAQGQAFGDLEDYYALKGGKMQAGEFMGIAKFPAAVRDTWRRAVDVAMDAAAQIGDTHSAKCMQAMFTGLPGPMVPKGNS
jgi:hypothetical protein